MKDFDPETIPQGNLTAICDKNSAQCKFLEELGFPDNNIFRFNGMASGQQIQMVLKRRVDFVIGDLHSFAPDIESLGIDPDKLIQVMSVNKTGLYVVASKSMNPQLLDILLRDRL